MKACLNRLASARQVSCAFTRLELIVVLASLGLLASLAVTALAKASAQDHRVVCANNLRQMGRAFHMWADAANTVNYPFWTPFSNGGLSPVGSATIPPWSSLTKYTWFQAMWLSNQVSTPKVLVCPSDTNSVYATGWHAGFPGGMANSSYQDRAVSYVIGLHASAEQPGAMLSADRNLRMDSTNANCVAGFPAAAIVAPVSNAQWLPAIHGEAGNFLFNDGQVQFLSTPQLQNAFLIQWLDSNATHFLFPMKSL